MDKKKSCDYSRKEREKLLWSYLQDVRNFLSCFNIPRDQIDDLVQDTFMAAWKSLDQLRDVSKMKSWLFAIGENMGRKYMNEARENSQNITMEEYYELWFDQNDSENYVDDEELFFCMNGISDMDLHDAMKKLSSKEYKILILYYAYGHDFKTISKLVGETHTNVRTTIAYRARLKLKKILEEMGYER